MTTLDQLIDELERGWERAEEPTWVAMTILADDYAYALLQDLKDAQLTRQCANGCNTSNDMLAVSGGRKGE